jgi:hypothetical protein
VQGRIDVPVGATLTHRHVALPVGEYTGTLRQPIISVDVERPVKINMIKSNLGAAAEGGRPKKEPSGRIWLPGSLPVDMLSQCAYSYGVKSLSWLGLVLVRRISSRLLTFFEMSWAFDRNSTFWIPCVEVAGR